MSAFGFWCYSPFTRPKKGHYVSSEGLPLNSEGSPNRPVMYFPPFCGGVLLKSHQAIPKREPVFRDAHAQAVESLREQGVEVGCLWRRRGRNRAADRLAQQARAETTSRSAASARTRGAGLEPPNIGPIDQGSLEGNGKATKQTRG